ncbi:MAG: oligoendopeptidase F family protein, partial [Firmicutes bacterium]|nr:oligoendopeptidase F family protein [Bacillota bacterium]
MGIETKTKQRNEIPQEYKWDIEDMFADASQWEEAMKQSLELGEQFTEFSGRLDESGEVLLEAMKARDLLWMTAEKVYVYARMKRDEDNRVGATQAMTDKAQSMLAKISAQTSFFTPELLTIPEETVKTYMEDVDGLKMYAHMFDELFREKEHVLSMAEENILAQMSEITSATNDIFSMINDADIKFGTIVDEDGETVEITHGNYIGLMQSHDRRVRKEAFEHMYASYMAQKNTLATTYNYNTKTDVVGARLRKYGSAMEAALSGDNVSTDVYNNLIAVVNEYLPQLHRYMDLRKKMLGVDEVHMYDVYVPLVEMPKEEIPYEKALEMINEALACMGEDYLTRMNKGFQDGWVDVYENEGKTSGAYS